jgi:hypothetical protein
MQDMFARLDAMALQMRDMKVHMQLTLQEERAGAPAV